MGDEVRGASKSNGSYTRWMKFWEKGKDQEKHKELLEANMELGEWCVAINNGREKEGFNGSNGFSTGG